MARWYMNSNGQRKEVKRMVGLTLLALLNKQKGYTQLKNL